jgi:hypothetical protein
MLPVVQRNVSVCKITWRPPACHTVLQILHNPIYAGAYAFARRGNRIRVVEGRARKTSGHDRPISEWGRCYATILKATLPGPSLKRISACSRRTPICKSAPPARLDVEASPC